MLVQRAAKNAEVKGGATLFPNPPRKGYPDPGYVFHLTFKPRTVQIGGNGSTVEQLRQKQAGNPIGSTSHLPSGGMAILSHPFTARTGIAPDVPIAKGVFFEITVEVADSSWQDGLGIGFTAQDPDQWPAQKMRPRYASSLPGTCLAGYSGRWVVNGHSEFIRNVKGSLVTWTPSTLRVGDVVTAVLVAAPADVIRIFVNKRLVAERSASDCPDPASRIWGVVDVDGCCVKLRLGNTLPEPEPGDKDLYDYASAARHDAPTELGFCKRMEVRGDWAKSAGTSGCRACAQGDEFGDHDPSCPKRGTIFRR